MAPPPLRRFPVPLNTSRWCGGSHRRRTVWGLPAVPFSEYVVLSGGGGHRTVRVNPSDGAVYPAHAIGLISRSSLSAQPVSLQAASSAETFCAWPSPDGAGLSSSPHQVFRTTIGWLSTFTCYSGVKCAHASDRAEHAPVTGVG